MDLSKEILSILLCLIFIISQVNCLFFASKPLSLSCPPSELFHPCECYLHADSMRIIRCGGHEAYDLMPIFYALSNHLNKDEKHFHMFYLNNTAIATLGNIFHDITFDYIYFDGASNLQSISPNAFDITGPYVKEVRAFDTQLKQSSLEESILGLSNLLHLTVSNVGQCPPEELLKPCKCAQRSEEWQWVHAKFTRIICGEDTEEDLQSLYLQNKNRTEEQIGFYTMRRLQIFFERLSENLNKINWQKRFDEFVLQNSPIVELPRNVFNDIIFYGIRIDNCPKLTTIHPLAFTITEPFVQELLIRRTKLANDRWKQRDIFHAITSLTNLRALYLHWSGLQSIPHHAFRPLKGKFQRKLVKVSIRYQNNRNQSLRMIGSYAFYYLSNIKSIDLSLNSIVKIHRNAFSLRWQSNEVLEINLAGNNLSDSSIEPSAFSEAQRPVHVILGQGIIGNPHLQHLDERVFRPFLKENSKNRVKLYSSENNKGGNRISCDCQSRWLFDDLGRIKHGLEDIMCISNANWECLPPCLIFGQELLHCGSNQYFNIRDVFFTLSRNLKPHEYHFKRLVLSNTQVETMPAKSFGSITFEQLELDGCTNLYHIDDMAFDGTKDHIKQIVIKQTTLLSRSKEHQLKLSSFANLTHLDLSFDGHFHLYNNTFETETKSNTTLFIRLNRDNIKNNSIEMNAFNGARRPIHLFFDSYKDIFDPIGCQLMRLEEEIYAPFLASNPYNQIHIMWCPIVCDCSIKWLFDAPKDWWRRVDAGDSSVGLQCSDHRSLYFYSDQDFRNCPKTNLLKYFVENKSTTTALPETTHKHVFLVASTDGISVETMITSSDSQRTTTIPSITTNVSTDGRLENTTTIGNSTESPSLLQTTTSSQQNSIQTQTSVEINMTEGPVSLIKEQSSSKSTPEATTTQSPTEYSASTVTQQSTSDSTSKTIQTQKITEISLETTQMSSTQSPINTVTEQETTKTSVNSLFEQNSSENAAKVETTHNPMIFLLNSITPKDLDESSLSTINGQDSTNSSITTTTQSNTSPLVTESSEITKISMTTKEVIAKDEPIPETTLVSTDATTDEMTTKLTPNRAIQSNVETENPKLETSTQEFAEDPKVILENRVNTIATLDSSDKTTTLEPKLESIDDNKDLDVKEDLETVRAATESLLNDMTQVNTEKDQNSINSESVTENMINIYAILEKVNETKLETSEHVFSTTTELNPPKTERLTTARDISTENNVKNNDDVVEVEEKTESNTKSTTDSEDNIDYLTLDTRNNSSQTIATTMNAIM